MVPVAAHARPAGAGTKGTLVRTRLVMIVCLVFSSAVSEGDSARGDGIMAGLNPTILLKFGCLGIVALLLSSHLFSRGAAHATLGVLRRDFLPELAFIALCALSIAFSDSGMTSFVKFTTFCAYAVPSLILAAGCAEEGQPDRLFDDVAWIANVSISGLSLWILFVLARDGFSEQTRFTVLGGYVHPNEAVGLIFAFYIAGTLARGEVGLRFWIVTFGLAVCLSALQSRGGLVSLGAGLLVALWLLFGARLLFGVLAAATAAAGFFLVGGMAILAGFASRGRNLDFDWTFENRTFIWNKIIDAFSLKQYLIGHGYGTISAHDLIFISSNGYDLFATRGAHNMFLQVYAGTGIFGLALFLLMIASFAATARAGLRLCARRGPPAALTGLLVYFLLHGMLEHHAGLNASAILLMLFFLKGGVLAGMRRDELPPAWSDHRRHAGRRIDVAASTRFSAGKTA